MNFACGLAYLALPSSIGLSCGTITSIEKAAMTSITPPDSSASWKLPVNFTINPVIAGEKMPAIAPAVFMIPPNEPASFGGANSVIMAQMRLPAPDSAAIEKVRRPIATIGSSIKPTPITEAAQSWSPIITDFLAAVTLMPLFKSLSESQPIKGCAMKAATQGREA